MMNFAITAQIKNIKVKYLLLLLFLTMLCMIILGLKLGFISLAWTEIVEILLIKAGILQATDISGDLVDVVWMLRMPRIILAACVGMGLTLSGIIMQAAATAADSSRRMAVRGVRVVISALEASETFWKMVISSMTAKLTAKGSRLLF